MKTCKMIGNRGFTLIELMVALAVLAILISFAAPSLHNSMARADIKQATDQVVQAFRTAKNTARISNSSVTLTLTTSASGNSISFLVPNGPTIPTMTLPEKISVSSNKAAYTFNPMGMINSTDTITLASSIISDHASIVRINNLLGYITTSYEPLGETGL